MKSKLIVTIADPENPEKRITLTAVQAEKFRSVILGEYATEDKDPSILNRRNPLFVKADSAVKLLDKVNFWEQEYDETEKYQIVLWLTRMLNGVRKRYANPSPAYLEIF